MLKDVIQSSAIKFFLGKYLEAGLQTDESSILLDVGVDESSNVHYQVLSIDADEEKDASDYEIFVDASGLRFLLEIDKVKYFDSIKLVCEPVQTDQGLQSILLFKPR